MKKVLISIITAVLIFGGLSANAFGKKKNVDLELLPTLKAQSNAENRIWVGTFQLAWNELMDNFTKGPVVFIDYNSPVVEDLNKQSFKGEYISQNAYYSKFGETSPELKKEIEKAIFEKFKEKSDILDSLDWKKGYGKYTAYAMLKKDFKFIKAFTKLEKEKFGKNKTKVEYFGINEKSDADLDETLSVLFYNSKDDFAIAIRTLDKDIVYLYRTNDNKTFDKLYSDMFMKKAAYDGSFKFNKKDELKVPNIDLFKMQNFKEFENKQIKDTDIEIGTALETVQFKMDNEGVKLKSEAIIMTQMCALMPEEDLKPRKFYFDDSFALFLQEYDSCKPYFAMRIADVAGVNRGK